MINACISLGLSHWSDVMSQEFISALAIEQIFSLDHNKLVTGTDCKLSCGKLDFGIFLEEWARMRST